MKKPKRTILNGIIKLVVFPYNIWYCFGVSDADFRKLVARKGLIWDKGMNLENKAGCAFQFDRGQTCLRLPKIPYTCQDYGILAHEIFHAVDMVLRRMGITLSADSDEVYAYTIDYVTKEVYKAINKDL